MIGNNINKMDYIKVNKTALEERINTLQEQLKISENNGDEIRAAIEHFQIQELQRILEQAPPSDESDNNELNEHGLLVFKHKTNKRLFLQKTYRWVDRLILLDETEGRQIIDS